jgi:hypothetical protein
MTCARDGQIQLDKNLERDLISLERDDILVITLAEESTHIFRLQHNTVYSF